MRKNVLKSVFILLLNIIVYMIYGTYGIIFILFSSICTFYFSKKISKNKSMGLTVLAICINFLPLLYFKYLNLLVQLNILTPLGISYYSLKLISYISDIYHDRYKPCKSLQQFLIYSLYTPTLFIGPINRYNDFSKEKFVLKKKNIYNGILRILIGLIKKVVVANKIAIIVNYITANSLTGGYIIFALMLYSIQLYFDFSGGIDCVLGISKMFGINLPENFNLPYLSESIKEFWHRWHITLSTFFRDYIYIPLGGNRGGKLSKTVNVIITFIISGLWHGIEYLIWGIIHGILVVANFKTSNRKLNIALTFILVSLLWIFFIYPDTVTSLRMLGQIFNFQGFNILSLGYNVFDYLIIIVFTYLIIKYELNKEKIDSYYLKTSFEQKLIFYLIIILIILLFGTYGLGFNQSEFIYGGF